MTSNMLAPGRTMDVTEDKGISPYGTTHPGRLIPIKLQHLLPHHRPQREYGTPGLGQGGIGLVPRFGCVSLLLNPLDPE